MGPLLESDDFDENKFIQIFANPLALFFQIRHFRHRMPTFLGIECMLDAVTTGPP